MTKRRPSPSPPPTSRCHCSASAQQLLFLLTVLLTTVASATTATAREVGSSSSPLPPTDGQGSSSAPPAPAAELGGGEGAAAAEEEEAKLKAGRARVAAILRAYERRMAPVWEARRKAQEADPELQQALRRLEAARGGPNRNEQGPVMEDGELNPGNAEWLVEGDIALTVEQAQALYGAETELGAPVNRGTMPTAIWPNGPGGQPTVPYFFDAAITQDVKENVQRAIRFWQENTCVRFVESTTADNKIRFTGAGIGCVSNGVGRQVTMPTQNVNINATSCNYVGKIAHEIAHALGFWHEQSRTDRDQLVTVNFANIEKDMERQFEKRTEAENNNYNVRYDYGSVMHYPKEAFAKNRNLPVLVARQDVAWQRTMGQRRLPSFYDVRLMNLLYNCDSLCPHTAFCGNGGIPRSDQNCQICRCPAGFTGHFCLDFTDGSYAPPGVPNTCTGASLVASNSTQMLHGIIGTQNMERTSSGHPPAYTYDWATCHWRIRASRPGRSIVLKVKQLGSSSCTEACLNGYTEVRVLGTGPLNVYDFGQTGLRLCCQADLGITGTLTITSGTGYAEAMVSMYAARGQQEFRLEYSEMRTAEEEGAQSG